MLHVGADSAVLDVNGLGLRVLLSPNDVDRFPAPGAQARVYTHLSVNKNDSTPRLFGFTTEEGRELFLLLTGVAGIGPSTAQAMLSAQPSPGEVAAAIARGDEKAIKVKGVGAKLTKRVVSELKDKLDGLATRTLSGSFTRPSAAPFGSAADDAMRALRSLQFEPDEARRLLDEVLEQSPEASADELVRAVLVRA